MNESNQTNEINFDGLIGPTHNYSGLSFGNMASMDHYQFISNPKAAAKQGLMKMRTLMRLGIKQGVLPPHERPFTPLLRDLGYIGLENEVLQKVWKENPRLLLACCSAASMWAANAATVSPSSDTLDQKVHFTPANLISKIHRSFEFPFTGLVLQKIFNDPNYFSHHTSLPSHTDFADEGAANHTRFCKDYSKSGVELFVFGRYAMQTNRSQPKKFPARQTLEASQCIIRLHRLPAERIILAQQNPEAIDSGVFHNDVIAVGNQNVFFFHEKAFANQITVKKAMQQQIEAICQTHIHLIEVMENQIPLREAIRTYLFNSQLITLPDGSMTLIAPIECRHSIQASYYLEELLANTDQPIRQVIYQDVSQSMQNGGGPACLRLRVVLTPQEYRQVKPQTILTESLCETLLAWIDKYYRDHLTLVDLIDPQFILETRQALDELTKILELGAIYPFQQNG